MTGTITWMCGFNRILPFNSVDYSTSLTLADMRDTTYKRTGAASVMFRIQTQPFSWVRYRFDTLPTNPSIAVAIWPRDFFNSTTYGYPKIYIRRVDGGDIELRWNGTTHTHDLYIGGSKVASGGIEVAQNEWFQLQMKCEISAVGSVQVKVDGHLSINYSGNTGATAAQYCYLLGGEYALVGGSGTQCNFDDWAIGYGDWLGDVRIEELVPNGDSSVQWSRSAGSANYENVDEDYVSDTDYNYTQTDGHTDELTLSDWDEYDDDLEVYKDVQCVMAWARMRADVATGDNIIIGVNSGGTEDTTAHPVFYYWRTYNHVMQLNPDDDQPWEDADLDALIVHYEVEVAT